MDNLLKLQDLDLHIQRLKERENEIPKQKNRFDIHRKRLAAELQESEDRLKRLQLEQRNCEGDIEQKQEQIRKYEGQLLAIKKNEEYQALLHEIDLQKKQIALKEERIISIMVELDEAKDHLEEDKKRIAAEQAEIDRECKEIDEELAQAVEERQALEAQRVPLLDEVPPDLLRRYRRIRRKIPAGPAVVPVSGTGDTCTGCHMTIRPQILNEIEAGKTHACSNCGRLLYHPENFEAHVSSGEDGD
ncbi:MAG: zinc ribbon domain-containing protein [Candidatus Hydrogenedentota bacterium]